MFISRAYIYHKF